MQTPDASYIVLASVHINIYYNSVTYKIWHCLAHVMSRLIYREQRVDNATRHSACVVMTTPALQTLCGTL